MIVFSTNDNKYSVKMLKGWLKTNHYKNNEYATQKYENVTKCG